MISLKSVTHRRAVQASLVMVLPHERAQGSMEKLGEASSEHARK